MDRRTASKMINLKKSSPDLHHSATMPYYAIVHVCNPMIIDAGLKKDFGRDLCFYGGLDLQEILCKGTPQQVADEARRLIDCLGQDGGYIFGPGHTYIQIDAPLANIMAMYATAAHYHPWS